MGKNEYRLFSTRHLPHYQPPGATLFITFRLAGSLPQRVIHQLNTERVHLEATVRGQADPTMKALELDKIQRYLFGKWDAHLGRATPGPQWLQNDDIAAIVANSIQFVSERLFKLEASCIMPNHVHLVCTPRPSQEGSYPSMAAILHSIKRHSARQANKLLNREGAFWQHESYDRVIRDNQEMERVVQYVLLNPVQAGLIPAWQDWRWSFLGEPWREMDMGL